LYKEKHSSFAQGGSWNFAQRLAENMTWKLQAQPFSNWPA